MNPDARPCWRAQYIIPRKDKPAIDYEVDVESRECPVSLITQESLDTVQRFFEARRCNKLGGVLYGPDSSRWPARWFDAVNLLELELEREEAAAKQAMYQAHD